MSTTVSIWGAGGLMLYDVIDAKISSYVTTRNKFN